MNTLQDLTTWARTRRAKLLAQKARSKSVARKRNCGIQARAMLDVVHKLKATAKAEESSNLKEIYHRRCPACEFMIRPKLVHDGAVVICPMCNYIFAP